MIQAGALTSLRPALILQIYNVTEKKQEKLENTKKICKNADF